MGRSEKGKSEKNNGCGWVMLDSLDRKMKKLKEGER